MSRSAEAARRFVRRLSELADRLAERDAVLASLHCDWASFGSWTLEVQKGPAADTYGDALLREQWDTPGPDVLRVSWDGRDRLLTIERAPTPPLSSPGPWKREMDTAFEEPEVAMRFVEEHIARWVRGEA
jgi:hypothetical protein